MNLIKVAVFVHLVSRARQISNDLKGILVGEIRNWLHPICYVICCALIFNTLRTKFSALCDCVHKILEFHYDLPIRCIIRHLTVCLRESAHHCTLDGCQGIWIWINWFTHWHIWPWIFFFSLILVLKHIPEASPEEWNNYLIAFTYICLLFWSTCRDQLLATFQNFWTMLVTIFLSRLIQFDNFS